MFAIRFFVWWSCSTCKRCFHTIPPLKYLYEHGKSEFVRQHFARRLVSAVKSFDAEDDRFYREDLVTVLYGDPKDGSDEPLRL